MHRPKKMTSPQPEPTQAVIRAFRDQERIKSDPLGSYTGVPKEETETPVQDADDL